jgi:carbon-monoxide dehydrogenase iron sulfur subunit
MFQEDNMTKERIWYVEDSENKDQICSRCRMCELICAFHHHGVGNPYRSRIRVVALGKGVDIPVTCLNCEDAPCVTICPTGAMHRPRPDGMVIVNQDVCIGCAMCVNACPVGAVILDPREGTALKCDLCDGEPQCVKYCPAGVLKLTGSAQFSKHRMKGFVRLLQSAND